MKHAHLLTMVSANAVEGFGLSHTVSGFWLGKCHGT